MKKLKSIILFLLLPILCFAQGHDTVNTNLNHLQYNKGVAAFGQQMIIPIDTNHSSFWNPYASIAIKNGIFYYNNGTSFTTPAQSSLDTTSLSNRINEKVAYNDSNDVFVTPNDLNDSMQTVRDSLQDINSRIPTQGITSVGLYAGIGVTIQTNTLSTTIKTYTITNSSPDQPIILNNGYGITNSGTYPNFTITLDSNTIFPKVLSTLSSGFGINYSGRTFILDSSVAATRARVQKAIDSLNIIIGTKQSQLNGTGFVKASGTTISYDNSTYLTTAVTQVTSSDGNATIITTTTTPVVTINSAPKLQTPRNINGVPFDGTSDITVTASAGTLTGTTINSTVVSSSLTSLGVLNGLSIADANNIIFGTSIGTKIGTSTSQKISFYNSTPIIQPTGDVSTALSNLGLISSPTIIATTNANLTGPITSVGNATSIASQTGIGSKFVVDNTPTIITPTISGHPTIEGITSTGSTGSGNLVFSSFATLSSPTLSTPNIGTPSLGVLTNCTGYPTSALPTISLTGNVTGSASAGSIATTIANGVVTNTMLAGSIDLTTKVIGILPVANGGTNTNSVVTTPTPTHYAGWDANSNFSTNATIPAFSDLVTAGTTTTLTVSSPFITYFNSTGTLNQTVQLPLVSTLVKGQSFNIINNSSGTVTVNSSGGNVVQTMAAGSKVTVTCIATTGTTASSWNPLFVANNGGVISVSNADGTMSVTPTSGAVVVSINLAHANTWTATQSGTTPSAGDNSTKYATTAYVDRRPNMIVSATSYTTSVTVNAAITDIFRITAQAGALLFNAPINPTDGQVFETEITDDGTARAITYNAIFKDGVPPTTLTKASTTVIGTKLKQQWQYYGPGTRWDLIGQIYN